MKTMQNGSSKSECPDAATLRQYVLGQLVEPELGQCEAHLAECRHCEQDVLRLNAAEPADGSFDQLVASSLQTDSNLQEFHEAEGDGPLVDRLIRDLVQRAPNPDQAMRALENRASEVNRLLPASGVHDSIGCLAGYEVKRLLGAGSTGVVYEAIDVSLQRRVALKVLRPSLGDAARERFTNEARAAAAIVHPNVITIYQVGEANELAFIAMELSDGQTLESRLNEVSFLPEVDLKRTAKQIAEGLAAAHGHGLIHRDIKPANIWIRSADGRAVILDFGLARIADDDPHMTATGMLAGTPNFMSPEQTRGLELDGRSDLFSLGCLMYRAATGKLPFGSTGILATLQAIQHDDSRPPILLNPHLTADFSDLVMTLLEKQPANRPDSADDLVAALSSEREKWRFSAANYCHSKQETGQLAASNRTPVVEKTKRNSRFRKWAMAGLLLLSLGAGIWGWFIHDWGSKQVAATNAQNNFRTTIATSAVRSNPVDTTTGNRYEDNGVQYVNESRVVRRPVRVDVRQPVRASVPGNTAFRSVENFRTSDFGPPAQPSRYSDGGFGFTRRPVNLGKNLGNKPVTSARPPLLSPVSTSDKGDRMLQSNLKTIVLGWHNYESKFRHLPPIGNKDKTGKSLLSWRVHILPFIQQQQLYSAFHLDEPWDSPHNLTLLHRMPEVYLDPHAFISESGKTRIQAPTGQGLIMDPDSKKVKGGVRFEDIVDGSSNTMVMVQVNKNLAVEWTKPQDWQFQPDSVARDLANGPGVVWCAFCDGQVRRLTFPLSGKFVGALASTAGLETIDLSAQTFTSHKTRASLRSNQMDTRMDDSFGGYSSEEFADGEFGQAEMGSGFTDEYGEGGATFAPKSAEPLYAGRTFVQWMSVVKNDRQLMTKFDALAAVAELAQGDDKRKQRVMDQIKLLLRKYGSNEMHGGDAFGQHRDVATIKNTFQNGELTHIFIEILRRFSDDDLMKFAIEEIKNGTSNSREFLTWFWVGQPRINDFRALPEYKRVMGESAVEIASAVLDTCEKCDQPNRAAMIDAISQLARSVRVESNSDDVGRSTDNVSTAWDKLLTQAFESGKSNRQGFVAVAIARAFPERPNLATDLVDLLADESVVPEVRAAGLYALQELPPEKIAPIADRLLRIGQQAGPKKDLLIGWTKKHVHWSSNASMRVGLNGSYPMGVDAWIGFMLSQLDDPPKELSGWLKELMEKAQADPGRAGTFVPDQAVENTKKMLAAALTAVDPDYELPEQHQAPEGGVF